MTIPELHAAIRSLVPEKTTTCVNLASWHFDSGHDEVAVRVSLLSGGRCEQVEAPTCVEALEKVKLTLLPSFKFVETPSAAERLAEMGV